MKFYTSSYSKIKNIPKDFILVSISGAIPDEILNLVDHHDKRLAPNWNLYKEYEESIEGSEREIQYEKRFKEEVLNKDINEIFLEWAKEFGLNRKYVLLCYEDKYNSFCHRHIVAEAIENKYGIVVEELNVSEDYERKDYKYKLKETLDETEW